MTVTDEQLMASIAGGGRTERDAAFRELVTLHRDRVYRLCLRYFRDPTDAEDATQEVLLTVLRRASTFRAEARLTTWLHRVTINTCHDIARRRARRPSTAVADMTAVADAVRPQADATELLPLSSALADALRSLSDEERSLIVRSTIEEVPYAEIAAELGVAVGTVKSRVHRLRARLVDLLGDVLDEDGGSAGNTSTAPPIVRSRPHGAPRPRGPPGR